MDKYDKQVFLEMMDAALNSLSDEDLSIEEQEEIRERWINLMRRLLKPQETVSGAS